MHVQTTALGEVACAARGSLLLGAEQCGPQHAGMLQPSQASAGRWEALLAQGWFITLYRRTDGNWGFSTNRGLCYT